MADLHRHDTVHETRNVTVDDRGPVSAMLIVVALAALTIFLVWLFAFSGWVGDKGNDTGDRTTIEQQFDQNQPQQQQPPAGDTGGTGDTGGQPAPGTSP